MSSKEVRYGDVQPGDTVTFESGDARSPLELRAVVQSVFPGGFVKVVWVLPTLEPRFLEIHVTAFRSVTRFRDPPKEPDPWAPGVERIRDAPANRSAVQAGRFEFDAELKGP